VTGNPDALTPAEEAFLDAHSGTHPLPASEVDRIVAAGRDAAQEARYPDVPHLAEIIAALPEGMRDPFSVSRWTDGTTLDHLGGEIGVREWLEAGNDPGPVIRLARQGQSYEG